jgi:hypothetical protein
MYWIGKTARTSREDHGFYREDYKYIIHQKGRTRRINEVDHVFYREDHE